jgi:hypothetical protein
MSKSDYIKPILINMYSEQCEHVHHRFSESYSKVSFVSHTTTTPLFADMFCPVFF